MNVNSGLVHQLQAISGATLTILALSASAFAQTEPAEERAERLFGEALQLMQSDHCQDAIVLFAESQALDPAAATLTNLATCYARLGKTASAYQIYRQAARAAILENKPELQKSTDEALTAIGPTLTRLRVVPLGGSELPSIRVNGQLVDDVRTPIPLDPGENIIEATAPGREPWRRTLSAMGEGTLMVLEVPDLTLPREPDLKLPKEPGDVAQKRRFKGAPAAELKPYVILATGVCVSGLAVGTVLAFGAKSKQAASNRYCDGRFCTQSGIDLRNDAADRAELATWSMGIGLVSAGAATALWYLSSREEQAAAAVGVYPWVLVNQKSAGLTVEGRL